MADFFVMSIAAILKLLFLFSVAESYDVCYPPDYSYSYSFYCYGENEHCCNSDYDCCTTLSSATIAGIVIGCIFGVGLMTSCICMFVQRNKRRPGAMLEPNQQASVSYVAYNGQTQFSQNPYRQQQFTTPQEYGQQQYTTPQQYGQQEYTTPQGYRQQEYMAPPPYSTVQFTHPAPVTPPVNSDNTN